VLASTTRLVGGDRPVQIQPVVKEARVEAARALGGGVGLSLHDLRPLVGAEVAADTAAGQVEGTLLSCTARSLWIVVGDVDHVVALPHLRAIRRR
jgi:hypothetical protein